MMHHHHIGQLCANSVGNTSMAIAHECREVRSATWHHQPVLLVAVCKTGHAHKDNRFVTNVKVATRPYLE